MTERAERADRCETCKWWDSIGESGACRRNPPQVIGICVDGEAADNGWWPYTNFDDFCGEWTLAPGLGIGVVPLDQDDDNA